MESIFGQPLSSSRIDTSLKERQHPPPSPSNQTRQALSHVDARGHAHMIDISSKEDNKRIATASCRVLLGQHAFSLVAANQIAKGDVLNVARIAGIQGAKQTSNLIPLCHNIGLTCVDINLTLHEEECSVKIKGEVVSMGKTGAEMEALTAVAVAGLTVYDMCKAVEKDIQITDVRLESKSGGKSGCWSR
ncbi:Cyclic pyranopterin monophosphate synthase accessory protein, mitochondrial [Apostasia shenzhenica]|uniref:cyclic pyranopterin monophosphate synthase n=1 Tax=Apostasia shenzhenica TaxID=1088818 RepID=A0A2I0B865_9ASPA|nr:Cyclic pyranopterin monophosphate synthase accessory protein, mitochondrial [Apostasia shenzhenica]